MNERTRILATLATQTAGTQLEISIFYENGGHSFVTGKSAQRGYWLAVKPFQGTPENRVDTMFQGCKALLQSAKRFGQKALNTVYPTGTMLLDSVEFGLMECKLALTHESRKEFETLVDTLEQAA